MELCGTGSAEFLTFKHMSRETTRFSSFLLKGGAEDQQVGITQEVVRDAESPVPARPTEYLRYI